MVRILMLRPKLIVILGPTSSGKSALGIKLAQKFNGEIISADSRQVYKGMDIGTGKIARDRALKIKNLKFKIPPEYISGGIPHHLLDVVSPKKQFTVADYKQLLKSAIAQIRSKGKAPFLVGGTAFYIYAAIDNWQIPEVKPNPKLRRLLAKKTAGELFKILKKLDPRRAKTIEKQNPARLIRAIEIVKSTGQPVPLLEHSEQRGHSEFISESITLDSGIRRNDRVLILGLNPPALKQRIAKSVDQRIKRGLLKEVKHMLSIGITFKRLKQIGLTYAIAADHLQKKLDLKQMAQKIKTAEWQYSRRQMTWFKRDQRIHWIKNQKQAEKLINIFLK